MEGPRVRQEPGVALGQAAVSRRMLWKLPLNVPVTAPPSLQHPTDGGGVGTESIPRPSSWVGRGRFPRSLIFYLFIYFSQGLQTLGCEFPGIPTCTKGRWPLSTQRGDALRRRWPRDNQAHPGRAPALSRSRLINHQG